MSRRLRVICLAGKWKLLDGMLGLKKNENFMISEKDSRFLCRVSSRTFVWPLRGAVRSDG
jgi:hypothetical protein